MYESESYYTTSTASKCESLESSTAFFGFHVDRMRIFVQRIAFINFKGKR